MISRMLGPVVDSVSEACENVLAKARSRTDEILSVRIAMVHTVDVGFAICCCFNRVG